MKPATSLTNSAKKTSMKPKSYSTMSIAGVVSFYMLVSIALVFQNKILLNEGLRIGFGTRAVGWDNLIYGVLLVVFIIFLPKGTLGSILDKLKGRAPAKG